MPEHGTSRLALQRLGIHRQPALLHSLSHPFFSTGRKLIRFHIFTDISSRDSPPSNVNKSQKNTTLQNIFANGKLVLKHWYTRSNSHLRFCLDNRVQNRKLPPTSAQSRESCKRPFLSLSKSRNKHNFATMRSF